MYMYSFLHIFDASFSSYKSEYLRTEEREEINKISLQLPPKLTATGRERKKRREIERVSKP